MVGIYSFALVRVELFLDGRLRVPHVAVSGELRIAALANSQHGDVPDSLYDPKIAFWHEPSFPQAGRWR